METKHLLNKALLTAAFALGTICAANAQSTNYGQHVHDYPISDDLAKSYMTKYFGYKPTTTGGTDYDNTKNNVVTTGPTEVTAQGQAILVEVNPYWRGVYKFPANNIPESDKVADDKYDYKKEKVGASMWQEVKYGVKAVHKLDEPTRTPDGYMFSYTGKLGRFYLARRRKNFYNEQWTNSSTSYYRLLGRWYEEWSFLPEGSSDLGWADFACQDHYSKFASGDVWYAPHDCYNSLDKNHFTSFIAEGEEDNFDGYDVTLLFYVSDYWDTESNSVKGKSEGATKKKPFICLLRTQQEETTVTATADGKYDITVTFNSTFNSITKALAAESQPEETWNNTDGGVREFFEITRTYVDEKGVEHKETVVVAADELTKDTQGNYTYTDTNRGNHFSKSGNEYGDDYTYEITSKIYPVDKDGNIKKDESGTKDVPDISEAKAPNQPAHIPGNESFLLSIDGETKCTYEASNEFGKGVNHFTHVINIKDENKGHLIADQDKLELIRKSGNSIEVVKTETLAGSYVGKDISTVLNSNDWKKVSKNFDLKGGESQDATYQLFLRTVKDGAYVDKAFSNIISLGAFNANIKKGQYNHRSGHPSGAFAPTSETYHNEVTFTPSTDGNIYQYAIICNGNTAVKDIITDGIYTRGEDYTQPELYTGTPVSPGEDGDEKEAVSMFYTAIAYDLKGNTYGSNDCMFEYKGLPEELVYYANADTETPSATTAKAAHHDNILEFAFSFAVNDGSGIEAADVDRSLMTGVSIYGEFTNESGEVQNEGLAASFEKEQFSDENSLFFFKAINIEAEYPGYWAIIQDATDQKKAWGDVAQELWYNFIPANAYIAVSYKTPEIQPTPSVSGVKREGAPAAGTVYTKFSNWAKITPPNFGNMPVTGIETVNVEATVKVYPNPATDQISFNALGAVEIYNLAGARVVSTSGFGITTVDVSHLPAGVYILRTGNKTDKFIVTK